MNSKRPVQTNNGTFNLSRRSFLNATGASVAGGTLLALLNPRLALAQIGATSRHRWNVPSVGDPIPAGHGGADVQIGPDGKVLYVGGTDGIVRLDLGKHARVGGLIPVPGVVNLIVVKQKLMWVLDQKRGLLRRIDIRRRGEAEVGPPVEVPDAAYAALSPRTLWVTTRPAERGGAILRLSSLTGEQVAPAIPLFQAMFAKVLGEVIWVSGGSDDEETLTSFNVRTGRQIGRTIPVPGMRCTPLSEGSGRPPDVGDRRGPLFTVLENDTLIRIDQQTRQVLGEPIPTGSGLLGVMGANGSMWALNQKARTVTHLDARSGEVLDLAIPLPEGYTPVQIAADDGGAWVLLQVQDSTESAVVRVAHAYHR